MVLRDRADVTRDPRVAFEPGNPFLKGLQCIHHGISRKMHGRGVRPFRDQDFAAALVGAKWTSAMRLMALRFNSSGNGE